MTYIDFWLTLGLVRAWRSGPRFRDWSLITGRGRGLQNGMGGGGRGISCVFSLQKGGGRGIQSFGLAEGWGGGGTRFEVVLIFSHTKRGTKTKSFYSSKGGAKKRFEPAISHF